jgi:hypothetical protein
VKAAIRFSTQIAEEIHALHVDGWPHRRLTPQDVIVRGDYLVVTGFERAMIEELEYPGESGADANDLSAARRRDTRAVAAILYQMLTGVPPPPSPDLSVPLTRIRRHVPPAVCRVLIQSLDATRANPVEMWDLVRALVSAGRQLERPWSRLAFRAFAIPPGTRVPTLLTAGTLVLILALGGVWAISRPTEIETRGGGPSFGGPEAFAPAAGEEDEAHGRVTLPHTLGATSGDYVAGERIIDSSASPQSDNSALGGPPSAPASRPAAASGGPERTSVAPRSTRTLRNDTSFKHRSQTRVAGTNRQGERMRETRNRSGEHPSNTPAPMAVERTPAEDGREPDATAIIDWLLWEGRSRQ